MNGICSGLHSRSIDWGVVVDVPIENWAALYLAVFRKLTPEQALSSIGKKRSRKDFFDLVEKKETPKYKQDNYWTSGACNELGHNVFKGVVRG